MKYDIAQSRSGDYMGPLTIVIGDLYKFRQIKIFKSLCIFLDHFYQAVFPRMFNILQICF